MKRVFKALAAFFIVALVFIVSLVVNMPAVFVVRQLETLSPQATQVVQLQNVGGTVWQGNGTLIAPGVKGALSWHLRPLGVFQGALPVEVDYRDNSLALNLVAEAGLGGTVTLAGGGWAELSMLEPMLKPNRIEVGGRVDVKDLNIQADLESQWLKSATGQLSWPGGPVSYPVGAEMQSTTMPPLGGELTMEGDVLHLAINQADTHGNLIDIRIDKTLLARVEARRRLVNILGLPFNGKAADDAVIFKVQQRLGQ